MRFLGRHLGGLLKLTQGGFSQIRLNSSVHAHARSGQDRSGQVNTQQEKVRVGQVQEDSTALVGYTPGQVKSGLLMPV